VEAILQHLLEVDGVLGALLLSNDGLPVASVNLDEDEAETVSALVTAMVAGMRTTSDRLGVGDVQEARLTTEIGVIEIHNVQNLLLLVFSETSVDHATLGHVLSDVKADCVAFAL
jgi:predicted regulator of Ras-like GTPase activity (Roadblock/LC7/MglB family)